MQQYSVEVRLVWGFYTLGIVEAKSVEEVCARLGINPSPYPTHRATGFFRHKDDTIQIKQIRTIISPLDLNERIVSAKKIL